MRLKKRDSTVKMMLGLNQVSKALDKVGVSIMDAEGKWKPFNQVLEEVALQWTNLDDVTKAYIATTMAGVRRQNQFLTLMDDLGKGAEGGSRAFELYGKAMESSGSATEKFGIWQESAAAAVDSFHNSMSMLYNQLDLGTIFKNSFEWLSTFIKKCCRGHEGLEPENNSPYCITWITCYCIEQGLYWD